MDFYEYLNQLAQGYTPTGDLGTYQKLYSADPYSVGDFTDNDAKAMWGRYGADSNELLSYINNVADPTLKTSLYDLVGQRDTFSGYDPYATNYANATQSVLANVGSDWGQYDLTSPAWQNLDAQLLSDVFGGAIKDNQLHLKNGTDLASRLLVNPDDKTLEMVKSFQNIDASTGKSNPFFDVKSYDGDAFTYLPYEYITSGANNKTTGLSTFTPDTNYLAVNAGDYADNKFSVSSGMNNLSTLSDWSGLDNANRGFLLGAEDMLSKDETLADYMKVRRADTLMLDPMKGVTSDKPQIYMGDTQTNPYDPFVGKYGRWEGNGGDGVMYGATGNGINDRIDTTGVNQAYWEGVQGFENPQDYITYDPTTGQYTNPKQAAIDASYGWGGENFGTSSYNDDNHSSSMWGIPVKPGSPVRVLGKLSTNPDMKMGDLGSPLAGAVWDKSPEQLDTNGLFGGWFEDKILNNKWINGFLSIFPPTAPYMAAINGMQAASHDDLLGTIAGAYGAYTGFTGNSVGGQIGDATQLGQQGLSSAQISDILGYSNASGAGLFNDALGAYGSVVGDAAGGLSGILDGAGMTSAGADYLANSVVNGGLGGAITGLGYGDPLQGALLGSVAPVVGTGVNSTLNNLLPGGTGNTLGNSAVQGAAGGLTNALANTLVGNDVNIGNSMLGGAINGVTRNTLGQVWNAAKGLFENDAGTPPPTVTGDYAPDFGDNAVSTLPVSGAENTMSDAVAADINSASFGNPTTIPPNNSTELPYTPQNEGATNMADFEWQQLADIFDMTNGSDPYSTGGFNVGLGDGVGLGDSEWQQALDFFNGTNGADPYNNYGSDWIFGNGTGADAEFNDNTLSQFLGGTNTVGSANTNPSFLSGITNALSGVANSSTLKDLAPWLIGGTAVAGVLSDNKPTTTATSVTNTPTIPDWYSKAQQEMAGKLTTMPLTAPQYTQPLAAGISENEQSGVGMADQATGAWAPQFANAVNTATRTALSVPETDLSAYMNPYVQNVLDPTLRTLNQNFDAQKNSLNAAAASRGAFGGSRNSLMMGLNDENRARALGEATNKGFSDAFNYATDTSLKDRAQLLGTANSLSSMAGDYQRMLSGDVNQLMSTGAAERGIKDNLYNKQYTDYLNQLKYPLDAVGAYSSGLSAVAPKVYANTVNTVATGAEPNMWSNLLGAGATGVSLYNMLFNNGTKPTTAPVTP